MLEHARRYAGLGWPIFRLTGYKTPLKGSHGFKDATVDVKVIEGWWGAGGRVPNIGLATGAILVVDADGTALADLLALARAHGGLPRTLAARTSNGWHFYFLSPPGMALRSHNAPRQAKGDPGIDLKGHGGYVVMPPSVNARTGFVYQWANWGEAIAPLPDWLLGYWVARKAARRAGPAPDTGRSVAEKDPPFSDLGLGPVPAWMADRLKTPLPSKALAGLIAGERPGFLQALRRVRADCGYDQWFKIGAAIYDFDSGAGGLAIFKAWSRTAEGYREEADSLACEAKWKEYGLPREAGAPVVTKATVYGLARDSEAGAALTRSHDGVTLTAADESGKTAAPAPPSGKTTPVQGEQDIFAETEKVNGRPATLAVPALFTETAVKDVIHWPDANEDGSPRATTTNAGIAIRGVGAVCRKDVFHEKMLIGGHLIDQWAGDLSDDVVLMMRKVIKHHYGFDPGEKNTRDAAVQLCLEHQFNPVVDYLDTLEWDGVARLDTWVVRYLGAEDTALNREFGRLMLIAAVRRARVPGTKFDQIIVLEGKEGTNKSTALKILAGEDNFSDQNILTASDREQQEAVCGVWIYEIAELAGMRRADIERVKQFASRTEDRARPAYGRLRIDRKRQCIFAGTTNKDTYLQSETGNRRFWSMLTGHIDVEALARDRDMLWAEASVRERAGVSLTLKRELWGAAEAVQEERREGEPWELPVKAYLRGKNDTAVYEILTGNLRLEAAQINQVAQNRVARILRDSGWEKYRAREGDERSWRYRPKA